MSPNDDAREDGATDRRLAGVCAALLVLMWCYLGWVAATLTVEFYDGFEYVVSGWALWGDVWLFFPKNPLWSSFFALLYAPFRWLGTQPSLPAVHLPVLLLHGVLLAFTVSWVRRLCPSLPVAAIAVVAVSNRLMAHYLPFALPDILAGLSVGLWYWADLRAPLDSRRGQWLRIAALAVCALGRLQTVLIPAACLGIDVVRSRRVGPALRVAAGGGALYTLGSVAFWSLGRDLGFLEGLRGSPEFVLSYLRYPNEVGAQVPGRAHLVHFALLLTPAGLLLLGLGAFAAARIRDTARRVVLAKLALGSLLCVAFLLTIASKDARYLSPLLPAWVLMQCMGVAWLARWRSAAGLVAVVVLFMSIVPELLHFRDPFYRRYLPHDTARTVERWGSPEVMFLRPMGAFYPEQREFSEGDRGFYFYGWGAGAYTFFTKNKAVITHRELTFERFGFPIPDSIRAWGPPGLTMLIPEPAAIDRASMPAIHAVRWWPPGGEPAGAHCDPRARRFCVEWSTVFEATEP